MKRIIIATIVAIALSTLALRMLGNNPSQDVTEKVQAEQIAHFETLKQLALQGKVEAQYELARLYRDGKGTARKPKKAFALLSELAKKGYAKAQYDLGQLYEKGEGTAQDYSKASEWYLLAARLGNNSDSQFALGDLYFNGRGVANDYAEALRLYLKAAAQGHAVAQYLVGAMYQDGWGVKSDYAEAYKWYSLALADAARVIAFNPLYDPAKALKRLEPKMKKFQIEQGKRRLEQWNRSH